MKKIICIILFLLGSLNINAQYYSIPFSFGLGYSHVYGDLGKGEYYNPSKDLIEVDFNVYYLYVSLDFMTKTKERYYDMYDPRFQYESGISTWGMKFGPCINIGLNYCSLSIIPYLGFMKVSDDWTIKRGYFYYDSFYSYDYYDYYNYYNRGHSKEIDSKFLWGAKVALNIDCISVGIHGSNMELGVNIGFNFDI